MYDEIVRPLLFSLPPHAAHAAGMAALALPEYLPFVRAWLETTCSTHSPALEVRTMGLVFPNPIGLAAGFDKDARRPHALAALGFGHLELGTVTARAQGPNPAPNLRRLPDDLALVNRLGFPNKGAAALSARLRRGGRPPVPIGISLGKSRAVPVDAPAAVLADYLISLRAVRDVADFVVINVSSPNTPDLRAMQRAEAARGLLAGLVAERDRGHAPLPLLLKVAPDLDHEAYDALLAVVVDVGLDGVVAANTTVARAGLTTPPELVAAAGPGGLSGAPLRARARSMVRRARERLGQARTVIGVGGVFDADDARALFEAGADLCQLYTGFVYGGPLLPHKLCAELARGATAGVSSPLETISERWLGGSYRPR